MILSILITSIIERSSQYDFIFNRLNQLIDRDNLRDKVEIISLIDNKEISTGEKRNLLKDKANGKYICYVDDDDDVDDDYFVELLNGIAVSNADVVTFLLNKYTDKELEYQNRFSKFLNTGYLGNKENKIIVMRPVSLCPHKKEFADKIKFPHLYRRADYYYMLDLDKLTKTEYHINKVLYKYLKNTDFL